jgi:hypothetical protein
MQTLHHQLMRMARGDEELVKRLVDYELQRTPGADEATLMENAIVRWLHDNR